MKFNKQIDDDIINAIVTLTTGKEFITELRDIATKEQIPFESIVRRAHSLRNNQIINNKYSDFEDEIIIYIIDIFPLNIDYAIELSSILICRTISAVKKRYYRELRHSRKYIAVTCGSKQGFSKNIKNAKRNETTHIPNQDLQSHEWLIKELLELPVSKRNKILSFFKE
jgi:hypothetical protein